MYKLVLALFLIFNLFCIEQTIRNYELSSTGTFTGVSITKSGRYFLEESLRANPTNDHVSCIKISTNDVIVDLNSYAIIHVKSGGGKSFKAIEIDEGLSSITIKNGTIDSIDGLGIKINDNCKSIIISNIRITGCTTGITATNLNSSLFEKLVITDIINTHSLEDASGIHVATSNNCKFRDVFIQIVQSENNAYGFNLSNSVSAFFFDCKAKQVSGKNNAYGIFLDQSSKYPVLENCTSAYNVSENSDSYGFYSYNGTGGHYKQCLSLGNICANASGKRACGFYFENENNTNLSKSVSKSNSGQTSHGIHLVNSNYCVCESNEIFSNRGIENGYGIKDDTASSLNLYIKNLAYANQDSTTNKKVNNYHVKLSPDNSVLKFPVTTVFLNDYKKTTSHPELNNIEIIERPAEC